jgi:hypothetical protein
MRLLPFVTAAGDGASGDAQVLPLKMTSAKC